MDTLPVTLIVKAPNHADYQDHTVKCELSWTIRRLKGHLSEVYPCKPVSPVSRATLPSVFLIAAADQGHPVI